MSTCDYELRLYAYHDGELAEPERRAVEAHVSTCGSCRALLDDLRGMSRMATSAPMADLPAGAIARIEEAIEASRQGMVLRTASWMTGLAASVLIGALLLWGTREIEQDRAGAWQTAALMPPGAAEESSGELVTLAQWMANDLSLGERR